MNAAVFACCCLLLQPTPASSWLQPVSTRWVADSRAIAEAQQTQFFQDQKIRCHGSGLLLGSTAAEENTIHAEEQSDKTNSKKDDDEGKKLDVLLTNLDGAFEYDGRMESLGGHDGGGASHRCGFVAVLGAPNMGKSTLLNALLQEDLCIATARPQTTRHAILGLLSTPQCQVCLVDTPGVIETPAYKLQEGMMEAVMGAFYDADVLLVVTDLFSTPIPDDDLFQKVQRTRKPVIVVINKIDLATVVNPQAECNQDKTVTPEQAIAVWRQLLPNALAILPASAAASATGFAEGGGGHEDDPGVRALRRILTGGPDVPAAIRELGRPIPGMFQSPDTPFLSDEEAAQLLPPSPPLYDPEQLTDRTDRFVASELIRSSLFETLKKELPYCCEVRINQFKEPPQRSGMDVDDNNSGGLIRIEADILVERDSQKVIVIGKGGEQVKKVGTAARKKLEEFFQIQIFLKLNVKVDKDWRKKESRLLQFGYLKPEKRASERQVKRP